MKLRLRLTGRSMRANSGDEACSDNGESLHLQRNGLILMADVCLAKFAITCVGLRDEVQAAD